jgi:hypothetical protein
LASAPAGRDRLTAIEAALAAVDDHEKLLQALAQEAALLARG